MSGVVSRWLGGVDALDEIASRLLRVQIENRPAIDVIRLYDEKTTLFYCDPPYVPLSASAQFTAYSSGGFGVIEQEALADAARAAARRGALVILSNHDTPLTRSLYQGAALSSFPVQRLISCKGESRHSAQELLAVW